MRRILFAAVVVASLVLCQCRDASAADLASVAESYVGVGEVGGNNRGPWVRRFGGVQGQPWCAAFVSHCLRKTGGSDRTFLGARALFTHLIVERGWELVGSPARGDVVLFSRGKNPKAGLGHIGIVVWAWDSLFVSVEGNVGDDPGRVRAVRHSLEEANIIGFARRRDD